MNFITTDQVGGLVRWVLTALGSWATAKGYVDGATATTVSGAILTLAMAGWSYYTNRQNGMILSINGKDNGVKVVDEFATTAPKVNGTLK